MYYYKVTVLLLLSSLLIAIALHAFLVPHHILEGGLIGVALLINYWLGIKIGLLLIVLSVPIYIAVSWINLSYVYRNVAGLLLVALWVQLLSRFEASLLLPPLWSAWIGGALIGTGIGVMFRYKISTDGIDMLAQLWADKRKANVGTIVFTLDMLILLAGSFILSFHELVLSLIAISMVGIVTTLLNRKPHHLNGHKTLNHG